MKTVILFQLTYFPEQGRVDIFHIANKLKNFLNVKVIVCGKKRGVKKEKNLTVHYLKINPDKKLRNIIKFSKETYKIISTKFKDKKVPIHGFNPSPATVLTLLLLRIKGYKNLIFDIRTAGVGRGVSSKLVNFANLCGYFIAKKVLVINKKLIYLKKKLIEIPLGANTQKVDYKVRKKIPLHFVYVGSLDKERKIDRIIQAFSKLSFNYKLEIVGGGSDFLRLKKMINLFKLDNKIFFAGKVHPSEVENYIKKSDVCISYVPKQRWFEYQLPLKLIEYLAFNKLTIATATKEQEKIFKRYPELLFQDSIESLSKKLEFVHDNFERINKTDFRNLVKHLSWENICKQIRDVY